MIIQGRSPTMRHESRTHRVALDWLFINLDPKIHIKYVDTKNQLADILTKGNFTRDEWNNHLRLLNISIFSSAGCLKTMAKRMQEEQGEEIIVAKSKPTLNLVSHTAASSLTVPVSSASNRPGKLRAPSQQGSNLIAQKVQGNLPLEVQIKMTQRRVLKCGFQMQKRTNVRGNSLLQEGNRIRVFKNVQGNLPQKTGKSSSTTTRSGRTITVYLVLTFDITRRSTRI